MTCASPKRGKRKRRTRSGETLHQKEEAMLKKEIQRNVMMNFPSPSPSPPPKKKKNMVLEDVNSISSLMNKLRGYL